MTQSSYPKRNCIGCQKEFQPSSFRQVRCRKGCRAYVDAPWAIRRREDAQRRKEQKALTYTCGRPRVKGRKCAHCRALARVKRELESALIRNDSWGIQTYQHRLSELSEPYLVSA